MWIHKCEAEKVIVHVGMNEPCNYCGEYQNGTTFPDTKKED